MSEVATGQVNETLLELKLVSAQDLKKSRHGAKQSPYCVITPLNQNEEPFDNEVIISKAATDQGSNPQWNQKALIKLTSNHKSWINVDIWSRKARSKDSYLGRARVPLGAAISTGQDRQRLRVVKSDGSSQGYLNVELSFVSVTAPQALQKLETKLQENGSDFVAASQEFHKENGSYDQVVIGNPLVQQAAQHQPKFEATSAPAASSMPPIEYAPPSGGFSKPSPPLFQRPTRKDLENAKRAQQQGLSTDAKAAEASAEYCQPFRTEKTVRRGGRSYYYYRPTYHYYYPFLFLFLFFPFFWPFFLFFPFLFLLSY